MKIVLLLPLLLLLPSGTAFSQSVSGDDPQITFAKEQFQLLIKKDFSQFEALYLSEEDITNMFNAQEPDVSEDVLKKALDNYDTNKKLFLDECKNSVSPQYLSWWKCDSMVWDSIVVDSVAYAYEVIVFGGRDERVFWPESKNYTLSDTRNTVCKAVIYFNDGVSNYVCGINCCYYNKKWRYYSVARTPKFANSGKR